MRRPTRKPQAPPGGRDDCWSDDATSALITAWGDRYLRLNRGSLRHKDWSDVAAAVNSRRRGAGVYKSDGQCKNRIDTLKKKFKLEKSKRFSSWVFFETLDSLIGDGAGAPSSSKRAESSGDDDVAVQEEEEEGEGGDACKELAKVIARFGESYERMERLKMEQEVELEKQRMKITKELEVERLNMFINAQLEFEKKKKRGDYSHHRHSHSGIGFV